jgi:ABC-type phosphate/phosphonate transport system substrate-binding protein
VRDDQPLRAQLRRAAGATIGFGQSYSTSNFLFPAWHLATQLTPAVNAFTSFSAIRYLGGHQLVAKAVYDGVVDLGAGHDGVIEDLADVPGYGDAEERLTTLYWTDYIPSDPIAANIPDATERDELANAIVAASKTQAGSDALRIFWGGVTELALQTSKAYDSVVRCMDELHVTGDDLLGP